MSHRAALQGIMRQVPSLLGDVALLTVRTRTSNAGVSPVTWSADVSIKGQLAQEEEVVEHDQGRHVDVRKAQAVLIYADTYTFALQGAATTNELPFGAEVKRADGLYWAVVRRLPSTAGLKRALLHRELPRQMTGDRGGRVV